MCHVSHVMCHMSPFSHGGLTFLNPEGHHNGSTGSRNITILLDGGRPCQLVELHWEGSGPAACAAGLFSSASVLQFKGEQKRDKTDKQRMNEGQSSIY